jgi:hypothetical protein
MPSSVAVDVSLPSLQTSVTSSPEHTPEHTPASGQASPVTPPEKLKEKIAQSSGPWSRALLSLAAKGKEVTDSTHCKASVREKLGMKMRSEGMN